ncbi:MAG: recombinase family protein [Eubacteriales bacterium]|nr:recombinase family protein [Eubacteriales bacterium]
MKKRINDITPVLSQALTKKRVAAYARVSSGKDAMLHSLAAQVDYYKVLIQQNVEWEFVGVYADEATTGTKENRAEFKKLIADCQNGLVDMVITKSISRFARNTVIMLETVRMLKDIGVDIFFEEQNIHSLSGDGELMLTILGSFAQEESLSVSENCKWRIRTDFQKGISNTIRLYGYDYKNKNLIVNQHEAVVVKMIFADYLSGMGKNAIVKKLEELSIPTKNGGRWSESVIASMLRNEKYIGDLLLQKKFSQNHLTKKTEVNKGQFPMYYVKDSHVEIIEKDMFDKVQEEIVLRQSKFIGGSKLKSFSEFTGIIHCKKCGANYRKKTTQAGIVWCCSTFNQKGKKYCASKQIPERILHSLCAEVLGIIEYDSTVLSREISHIEIPENGFITFVFHNGENTTRTWNNPSRAESWTPQMRENARQASLRRSK